MERLDVRVLHAPAGDARLSRHAPRRNLPRRRGAADPIRTSARRPLGHLRVGVQRAGPRPELSVPRVRRAGARVEARPRRRPGRGPVRDPARGAPRAARRAAQSGAAHRRGPGRPLWVLRGDRLHPRAEPRRVAGRRAADLHGAPPGHEPRRPRQRAARRADAAAVPRGSARPGRRPVAPGAHPAPRAAEEPADRNRGSRPDCPAGRAVRAPLRDAAHAQPARAPALERVVLRDGHQRGRRLQPASAGGADAVARGRHDRRVGQLLLRARPRRRRRLVRDLPADRPGARGVRGDLRAGPRRVAAPGRRHRDPYRSRRLPGRRCGAAPRLADQSQRRDPQPRAHQLRRGRPRAGRRRPVAPGVQQSVHRDPQRAGARCADLRPASTLGRAASLPGARAQRPRPHGRGHAVRNRSRTLHRPGRHTGASGRVVGQRRPVRHDGPRPRPHRQPPAVAAPAPRRDRAVRVHDRVCRERRSRAAPDREVPRSPRGGTRAGAGQHAQPDRAAAPQPDRRGHDRVSAPRGPPAHGRHAAAPRGRRRGEPERPARAVEVRHLRGSADSARPRRRRGCAAAGHRALESARVSAPQGPVVRPRHPQRPSAQLPPRPARGAAAADRQQSGAIVERQGRAASFSAAPI